MQAALKFQTTVLPGHRIEVAAPDIPEGASVELVVYRLPETDQSLSVQEGYASSHIYPETLNAEYEALIQTQWQRDLTVSEQMRLDAIKAEMNALDAASGASAVLDRQLANIHQQLAAIRKEVEALPDLS